MSAQRRHHPLTTDIPQLPVPEVQGSLDGFRTASSAVCDAETLQVIDQDIADFLAPGPHGEASIAEQAHDALLDHAEEAAHAGGNWMEDAWYASYLSGRDPLLLSSNVLFQLNLTSEATEPVERIVQLLQRIGSIHVTQAAGATELETDAPGTRQSMDAWAVFNGGIRTPRPEQDERVLCELGAENRSIGVVFRGRMFQVAFTGATGHILTPEILTASLTQILKTEHDGTTFAARSALGSGILAELPALEDADAQTYQALTDMLFVLTIDELADSTDEAATLHRWVFEPGNSWAYKPLSYLTGLSADIVAVNVEHSGIDGGTLAAAVTRMQQVNVEELETETDTAPTLSELRWESEPQISDEAWAAASGEALRSQLVLTHRKDKDLPFKISLDAAAQLVMMLAQQLTYGTLRAHYQACDMRHFRAGRTEAIRPVTPEARTFVESLVEKGQDTDVQLFQNALQAHRGWVKAAKTGRGFDRHLMMLTIMAAQQGHTEIPLFSRNQDARTDFLSTSTMGPADPVVRFPFAPTTPHGFGVQYTIRPEGTEFAVSWFEGATPEPERFVANLSQGADLLWEYIDSLPRD